MFFSYRIEAGFFLSSRAFTASQYMYIVYIYIYICVCVCVCVCDFLRRIHKVGIICILFKCAILSGCLDLACLSTIDSSSSSLSPPCAAELDYVPANFQSLCPAGCLSSTGTEKEMSPEKSLCFSVGIATSRPSFTPSQSGVLKCKVSQGNADADFLRFLRWQKLLKAKCIGKPVDGSIFSGI